MTDLENIEDLLIDRNIGYSDGTWGREGRIGGFVCHETNPTLIVGRDRKRRVVFKFDGAGELVAIEPEDT